MPFISKFDFKLIRLLIQLLILALLSTISAVAMAQISVQNSITGKIVASDDGTPLIGVVVSVKGSNINAVSDFDGNYIISVPDTGLRILVFQQLGFKKTEIAIGGKTRIDVVLPTDVISMNEVIVTGVAEGTQTKKLGFAIGKVTSEILSQVPASDAASALRGKIAGVQIVQGSGLPGSPPSIQLRGVNSIQGSKGPLIIVDGQITQGGLEDINMQDVERIEVIKGAAAASLYGSQAGNGVIQIITKRGSQSSNKTSVTIRNEVGFNSIQKTIPLATHHYYRLNPDGSFARRDSIFPTSDPDVYDTISNRIPQSSLVLDQPFQQTYNHQKEVFDTRMFVSNYVQVGSTGDKTTFLTSFENQNNQGVVTGFSPFVRRNARLNVDHKLTDKLNVSVSALYSNITGQNSVQNAQSGVFYGMLYLDPDLNLKDKNPDGTPYRAFFKDRGDNANNPLYEASNLKYTYGSDRILAGFSSKYKVAKWWRIEGSYSMDFNNSVNMYYKRKGYLDVSYPNGNNPGDLNRSSYNSSYQVASLGNFFTKNWSADLQSTLLLKYQFESNTGSSLSARGSKFTVGSIPQFQAFNNTSTFIESREYEINTENFFGIASTSYKDRYIVDAVLRRDASSLFGPDSRTRYYYRFSGAYRITEDIKIPNVQELKLRMSYGTSGSRPTFEAQYDVYDLNNGNALPVQLANRRLRPSQVSELEYGINAYFGNRYTLEINHAISTAKDNIINAPIPGYTGNTRQYQNNSTLRSNTVELAFEAEVFKKGKWKWSLGLTASHTTQYIQQLEVPQYSDNTYYRVQEGVSVGAMYGNVFAKSTSDLEINASGEVTNVDRNQLGPVLRDLGLAQNIVLHTDNFEVNDLGYLILKNPTTGQSLQYTTNERAIRLFDPATGQAKVTQIGDAIPKLITGLRSTLSYKNWSFYNLIDSQWGGDVYNYTKQLLYYNLRAQDLDQSDRPENQRHSSTYYNGSLYNGGGSSKHFVESGTYTTLRELNLSYAIKNDVFKKIKKLNAIFFEGRISFVARNLLTLTNYSGYTPEVSAPNVAENNAPNTLFRTDNFSYPLFRTYSVALELKF